MAGRLTDDTIQQTVENLQERDARRRAAQMEYLAEDPRAVAEGFEIGGQLGIPADVVLGSPDVYRSRLRENQNANILKDTPRLRDWLGADRKNTSLARDDLENLSWFERLAQNPAAVIQRPIETAGRALSDLIGAGETAVVRGISGGYLGMEGMMAAIPALPTLGQSRDNLRLLDIYQKIGEQQGPVDIAQFGIENPMSMEASFANAFINAGPERRQEIVEATVKRLAEQDEMIEWFQGVQKMYEEEIRRTQGDVTVDWNDVDSWSEFGEWAAYSIGQGVPSIAFAGLMAVIGGPVGATGAGYTMGLGDITSEGMREMERTGERFNPNAAYLGAAPYALTENIGFVGRRVRGMFGAAAGEAVEGFLKRTIKGVSKDAAEEYVNEFLQAAITDYSVAQGTNQPFEITPERIAGWHSQGMAGAITGGALGAGQSVLGGPQGGPDRGPSAPEIQLTKDMLRATQAGRTAATLQAVDKAVAQSNLRELAPEKFAEAIERMGLGDMDLFVPAEDMQELFQSRGLPVDDATLQEWGVERDEFDAALVSGSDVAIPMSVYAAKISGTEEAKWFGEYGTTNPNEMSVAEARAFAKSAREDAAILQGQTAEDTARLERRMQAQEQIYKQVYDQLVQADTAPDIADVQAQVMATIRTRLMDQFGEDAWMAGNYDRLFNVQIRRTTPEATAQDANTRRTIEQGRTDNLSERVDTPEFRNWFRDSKVVDEQGNPLVVYHGTTSDIESFLTPSFFTTDSEEASAYTFWGQLVKREERLASPPKYTVVEATDVGDRLSYTGIYADIPRDQIGVWWATDNGVARRREGGGFDLATNYIVDYGTSEFTDSGEMTIGVSQGDNTSEIQRVVDEQREAFDRAYPPGEGVGGNVVPVYLSIQNPIEMDAFEANRLGQRLEQMTPEEVQAYIADLEAQGYDGIKTVSDDLAYTMPGMGPRPVQYIAFSPEQIKSVNNRGTFDPSDPRILYQGGERFDRNEYDPTTDDAPGADLRIATRFPQQARSTEDPIADPTLQVDIETMKAAPAAFEHNMSLVVEYPSMEDITGTPDEIAEEFKRRIKDNLVWLYNAAPEILRTRGWHWYNGARRITEAWAERYGLPHQSVAGALAALSPQKDWFQNVSPAERVLDALAFGRDIRWGAEMTAKWESIGALSKYDDIFAAIDGKTLQEVIDTGNIEHVAAWVRTYDETFNDRAYAVLSPEGDLMPATGRKVAWGSLNEVGKAVSVILDPSLANVSARMGSNHKVRSFYNNIVAPDAKAGDVTIDTHAVAAALIRPLSQSAPEVSHAFGTGLDKAKQPEGYRAAKKAGVAGGAGLYGVYADAYREAAAEVGILPRQMQSITWEAIRLLYPDSQKRGKMAKDVEALWRGDGTIEEKRDAAFEIAGGIGDPAWAGSDSASSDPAGASTYEGELAREGRSQRGRDDAGTGSGGTGAVPVDGGRGAATGSDAGPADAAGVRGAPGGRGSFRGLDLEVVQTFDGARPVYEIADPAAFRKLISQAQTDLGPVGAQVTVYDDYAGKRLFVMDDGYSGFALDGNDIISVFSVPGAAPKGAVKRIMEVAVPEGGRRLDAFDTFLPKTYARAGFRAVAKLPFSREYAPDGWDYDFFAQELGNSDPDVVFMVYDPENASQSTDNAVGAYEDGMAAQEAALEELGPTELFQDDTGPRGSIQLPSGGVMNGESIINLFESANESTFFHELGHLTLEAMMALSQDAAAPQQIRDDMATIRAYLGMNDQQKKPTTAQHEVWARTFEAYLMEGKSPSIELSSAFSRIKSWFIGIYKDIGNLNVNPTPEVKDILDRMLATDQHIEQAQAEAGQSVLFAQGAPEGMSESEWASYQKLAQRRQAVADQRLLDRAMAKVRRAREAWFKEEKKAVTAEVEEEYRNQPVYRAIGILGNKVDPSTGEAMDFRLSKTDIESLYGDEAEAVLNDLKQHQHGNQRHMYGDGDNAVPVAEIAELLGYKDPATMIDEIRGAQPMKQAVETEVDRILAERHGDPLNDGSIAEEAMEAIHNDQAGQMMAAELRVIAKQSGRSDKRLRSRMFRARAEAMLGQMQERNVRPEKFLAAERKAARAAEKAWRRVSTGKNPGQALAEAYQAKEQQVLNHHLYMLSRDWRKKMDRMRTKMRDYERRSVQEKIGSPHIDQILGILADYDFRQRTQKDVENYINLDRYIRQMEEEGRDAELNLDPRVIDKANLKHFSRLTVDELNGVFDTVTNIETIGRRTREVVTKRRKREFRALIDGLVDKLLETHKQRPEPEGVSLRVRQGINLLSRADTIFVRLDGGEEMGEWYDAVKRDIDLAQSEEQGRSVQMMEEVTAIYQKHYSNKEMRGFTKEKVIPNAGTWTKEQILSLALNVGNEDNFQRVMDERVDERVRMTPERLDALLATLDERDWRFVQETWDYVNSYWPEIAEVEKRRSGVEPKKVQPRMMWAGAPEFVTGGYYRLYYDPKMSSQAYRDQQSEYDKQNAGGRGARAQVGNKMTIERQSTAAGRAIDYKLINTTRALRESIRFITLSEAVDAAARILADKDLHNAFIATGTIETKRTLELWVKDVANGPIYNSDLTNTMFRTVKNNFTLSRLAFNMKTVILQLTGISQSAVTIGTTNLLRGYAEYGRGVGFFSDGIVTEISNKSAFMSERKSTFQKDVYDFFESGKVNSQFGSRYMKAKEGLARAGFAPIVWTQFYGVDVPTWLGAYGQALREGKNEESAVLYADRMVARSQDSGLIGDRAGVERGTLSETTRQADVVRIFTTLAGYMMTKLNRANVQLLKAQLGIKTADNNLAKAAIASKAALDMMILFAVEPAAMMLMYASLTDEDEPEDRLQYLAWETGAAVVAGIPIARDILGDTAGFTSGGVYGAMTNSFASLYQQVWQQGELDDAAVRSAMNLGGLLTGAPTTAMYRLYEGFLGQDDVPLSNAIIGSNPLMR